MSEEGKIVNVENDGEDDGDNGPVLVIKISYFKSILSYFHIN
jgi:hypothetical protein